MTDTAIFVSKSPWIMKGLMNEFALSDIQSAAILGNIGEECDCFHHLQEVQPIGGGRGGYGWCQWTNSRRDDFERYAAARHLDTSDDQANYGFLISELRQSQRQAIDSIKSAGDLEEAVKSFERAFERARAGVEHFDRRIAYAQLALNVFRQHDFTLASLVMDGGATRDLTALLKDDDAHLTSHAHAGLAKPTVDRSVATTHKSSRNGAAIDTIVIHYTTSRNIEGTIDTFVKGRLDSTGKLIRTSAHYIVGRDGTLIQMVDDSDAAWHAGGTQGMNARSIGIEHSAAPGDELTPEQEQKTIALIRWLVDEYAIDLSHIIPHDQVHSTECPGQILNAYGKTHTEAVANWVRTKIGGGVPVG